jgi:hypothetical protein
MIRRAFVALLVLLAAAGVLAGCIQPRQESTQNGPTSPAPGGASPAAGGCGAPSGTAIDQTGSTQPHQVGNGGGDLGSDTACSGNQTALNSTLAP